MSRIPFDTAEIRALAQILADTGLTEIEIAEGETRIRVARAHAPAATYAAMQAAPAALAVAAAPQVAEPADEDHPGAVTSPMVGVIYLSPEPGQAPFVVPGQTVVAGQTLLLIEAMKTFNAIKAPHGGVVSRILVTTGAPVEFGEVLLVIE